MSVGRTGRDSVFLSAIKAPVTGSGSPRAPSKALQALSHRPSFGSPNAALFRPGAVGGGGAVRCSAPACTERFKAASEAHAEAADRDR